jgi:hypothetical protein
VALPSDSTCLSNVSQQGSHTAAALQILLVPATKRTQATARKSIPALILHDTTGPEVDTAKQWHEDVMADNGGKDCIHILSRHENYDLFVNTRNSSTE